MASFSKEKLLASYFTFFFKAKATGEADGNNGEMGKSNSPIFKSIICKM
jgi:hypothetical protein